MCLCAWVHARVYAYLSALAENNSWRRASEMLRPSTGVLEFRQRGGAGINN